MTVWTAVRGVLLLLALAPFAYYTLAIAAAWLFFRRRGKSSTNPSDVHSNFAPPISILKPIRGLDRETYKNYASFCRQDYPEFEILFCVSDNGDPAVSIIEQLIRDFPERSIRLLVGSEPTGVSDKVNKLCRMVREARHEVVLVSDSDVRVEEDFLRNVVAPFRDAQVGGVTCLYRGLVPSSFAATLEALGNSTDFAPSVLVARLGTGGRLDFMLGAVMATTKRHLAEIGGFESIADFFADDYELGNRLAAHGYTVELSRFPVSIVYPRESLGAALQHQVRWYLSIRCSRPMGHLGLMLSQGLPWAVLAACLAPHAIGAAYLAVYVLLRAALALVAGRWGMKDQVALTWIWLIPIRDAFAFMAWIGSFFPRRIHWRDRDFYVCDKRLVTALPPRS